MECQWKVTEQIRYLSIPEWENRGAKVVFTSRHQGFSQGCYDTLNMALHVGDDQVNVLANREKVMHILPAEPGRMVCCEQIHGAEVVAVTDQDAGRGARSYQDSFPGTDGLTTNCPGLVLTTFYADCIPVFLFDPVHMAIGLAHSGWKGTMATIARRTMQMMKESYGSDPGDTLAFIGPGISKCCFEIKQDLADKVARAFPDYHDIISLSPEKTTWDLKETIRKNLIDAGIPYEQITVSNLCTSCNTEDFFSYRKENGQTGRMAAMIVLLGGDADEGLQNNGG